MQDGVCIWTCNNKECRACVLICCEDGKRSESLDVKAGQGFELLFFLFQFLWDNFVYFLKGSCLETRYGTFFNILSVMHIATSQFSVPPMMCLCMHMGTSQFSVPPMMCLCIHIATSQFSVPPMNHSSLCHPWCICTNISSYILIPTILKR